MYVRVCTGPHVYLDHLTSSGCIWNLFAFIIRVEAQHYKRPKLTELHEASLNISWRTVVLGRDCYITLRLFNPLTPELNLSAQRCLTRFFTGDFASLTVHFVNTRICVKTQQIHKLFIQFINHVW
jgi:hypothetical protein